MGLSALALEDHVTVPLEPVDIERLQDEVRGPGLLARRIDVLNTKKPEPVMDSGLQIAGYRGN